MLSKIKSLKSFIVNVRQFKVDESDINCYKQLKVKRYLKRIVFGFYFILLFSLFVPYMLGVNSINKITFRFILVNFSLLFIIVFMLMIYVFIPLYIELLGSHILIYDDYLLVVSKITERNKIKIKDISQMVRHRGYGLPEFPLNLKILSYEGKHYNVNAHLFYDEDIQFLINHWEHKKEIIDGKNRTKIRYGDGTEIGE